MEPRKSVKIQLREKRNRIHESRMKRNHGQKKKFQQLIGFQNIKNQKDIIFEDIMGENVLELKEDPCMKHGVI